MKVTFHRVHELDDSPHGQQLLVYKNYRDASGRTHKGYSRYKNHILHTWLEQINIANNKIF